MSEFNRYQALATTKTPLQIFRVAKADGLDDIACVRLLRELFGLSLVEAKTVLAASHVSDPAKHDADVTSALQQLLEDQDEPIDGDTKR